MMNEKTYTRNRPDLVADELAAALLAKTTYIFNDLFVAIYEKLRARNATSGGEEMLRLRVYEKLQGLVSQGIVRKTGKSYAADKSALRNRLAEMTAANVAAEQRRGSLLHSE